MKKYGFLIMTVLLLTNIAMAVSGDCETAVKSGTGNVYSYSVMSPIYRYTVYVKETADSSIDVDLKVQMKDSANGSYSTYPGFVLSVDHLKDDTDTVAVEPRFVRIKLCGFGKGRGSITAN